MKRTGASVEAANHEAGPPTALQCSGSRMDAQLVVLQDAAVQSLGGDGGLPIVSFPT